MGRAPEHQPLKTAPKTGPLAGERMMQYIVPLLVVVALLLEHSPLAFAVVDIVEAPFCLALLSAAALLEQVGPGSA